MIVDVNDTKDLQQHFLLDNPNGNGTDPTGGAVDYSYPMKVNGVVKPNVNGDTTWGEIPLPNPLIENTHNGIKLKMTEKLTNGVAGSVRLISRKLFKGGLFVFDIEHAPYGCSVWPAVWLNGFVGGSDQYHAKKGSDLYKRGMKKLVKSTLNKSCITPLDPNGKPDPHLSEYLGRPIYVGMWPMGGEIDILEQTNFSNTNLMSIHSGPRCEVTSEYGQKWWKKPGGDYSNLDVHSACGQTYSGFGPYSGCKQENDEIDKGKQKLSDGAVRYTCPGVAAYSAGNTQTIGPPNSFGELFNRFGGGVYAVQWIPKKIVYIWYWPRRLFSDEYLSSDEGPLSDAPNPSAWPVKDIPDKQGVPENREEHKILVASYNLNSKNAMTEGCDFNFQSIIINTTLGGGFGGIMPSYCSVDNKSDWRDYITKCYEASPERAMSQGNGVDPQNGCYDGGLSEGFRGANTPPVFFSEAYFTFRKIRVFQKDGDDNIW